MSLLVSREGDEKIWKRALWLVPLIVITGSLSGYLANSGYGNDWFDRIDKPSFMPPGQAFGIVWPALYTMLALALATVLNEPPSAKRTGAITLFILQLLLNYSWSYVFFAAHAIIEARWLIIAILVLAAITAGRFYRIRPLAGWLMVPYLLWLIFAATLNGAIIDLNPGLSEPLFG